MYDGAKIQPTTWWDDKSLQFKILLEKLFGEALDFIIPPAYGNESSPYSDTNYKKFFDDLKQKFLDAETIVSPIILDLNGDGIATTSLKNGVYFDHDGNGLSEQTAWVNGQDGLLVK